MGTHKRWKRYQKKKKIQSDDQVRGRGRHGAGDGDNGDIDDDGGCLED